MSVQRSKTLAQSSLIERLSKQFDENREEFSNNLCLVQPQKISYKDIEDESIKEYLEVYYTKKNRTAEEFAMMTIMKSLFIQKRVAFSISQDALLTLLETDPDIQYNESDYYKPRKSISNSDAKPRVILKRILAKLAQFNIYQIWSHKGRRAGGYACVHPDFLNILDLSDEQLTVQYEALQAFCDNYSRPAEDFLKLVGERRNKILNNKEYIIEKKEKTLDTTEKLEDINTIEKNLVMDVIDTMVATETQTQSVKELSSVHNGVFLFSDLSELDLTDDVPSAELEEEINRFRPYIEKNDSLSFSELYDEQNPETKAISIVSSTEGFSKNYIIEVKHKIDSLLNDIFSIHKTHFKNESARLSGFHEKVITELNEKYKDFIVTNKIYLNSDECDKYVSGFIYIHAIRDSEAQDIETGFYKLVYKY